MPDIYDSRKRSALMSGVRDRNTKPEIIVRRILHRMGYRFRLHRRDLPGRPDIVLPRYRAAVFVNGCFWHQHEGCKRARRPESNRRFWDTKLNANVLRDRRNRADLEELGWIVHIVWECEASRTEETSKKLFRWLQGIEPQQEARTNRNVP